MFRAVVGFWILVLVVATFWVGWTLTRVTDADRQHLAAMQERIPLSKRGRSNPLDGYSQLREGLRRDVWSAGGEQPRQQVVHLSDSAHLTVNQRDQELVETLQQVHCLIQEDLDLGADQQTISELRAEDAVYDYNRQKLHVQPVRLSRYRIPGHSLPASMTGSEPIMAGRAAAADVNLQGDLSCDNIQFDTSQTRLEGAVSLTISGGMSLRCDRALLDRQSGYGRFECVQGSSCVVRGQAVEVSGQEPVEMALKARVVEIWLDDAQEIREMVAEGDVQVFYGLGWTAKGDRLSYRRGVESVDRQAAWDGVIELSGEEGKDAQVAHAAGSRVVAERVALDTASQQLTLTEVTGTLVSSSIEESSANLSFRANVAIWNHIAQKLALLGDVDIHRSAEQWMKTKGEVGIHCGNTLGRFRVTRIESAGPTNIAYGSACQSLTCQGRGVVDLERETLHVSSPRGKTGRVAAEQQVTLKDSEGEIRSDDLSITYTNQDGQMVASGFVAKGHVCLMRQVGGDSAQYSLADAVTYQSQTGELLFEAVTPRRVIFFDRKYDVKVSAPQVRVTRDPHSGQDVIRGIGDVRLTLLDQELAWLRQRFSWEESEK